MASDASVNIYCLHYIYISKRLKTNITGIHLVTFHIHADRMKIKIEENSVKVKMAKKMEEDILQTQMAIR